MGVRLTRTRRCSSGGNDGSRLLGNILWLFGRGDQQRSDCCGQCFVCQVYLLVHYFFAFGGALTLVLSSVQILDEDCVSPVKERIEKLLESTDQNKQRAAAELLAGLLGGTEYAKALDCI